MIVRGELHYDPEEELIHAIEHPEEYENADEDRECCSWLKRRGLIVYPAPSLWLSDSSWGEHAVADADGTVSIYRGSVRNKWMDKTPKLRTHDPRQLIVDLQRIVALAEDHFGEGWGRDTE